ncbi:MAG TPA: PAS domain S-box protein, partial [Thermoanaerobaculia bacterium]|nr:PAS domain S-box protein [Thermoanaerobaculia bacterium]
MPIYKALFELSIDAILVADAEGRFVDANPAARKLLGLPREEILGRHIMELSDPALDFPTAWGALHSGGSLRGEWRLRHSDGTYRDVEFAANASVEPGRSAAILRDVTEKKRAEHELKAS